MDTEIVKTESEQVINPFRREIDERLNAGTVEVEIHRAVAEVQAALLIAKRFPRNKAEAFEKIIATCCRTEFAEAATYSYPRGGQTITGPSIRLAEEMARAWGNVEFGIRELAQYDDETEMESFCWDTETNVRSKQTFRVKHERHTRQGITELTDPRDIYENNANLGARRLRSRILAIIPPDVVNEALKQCKLTVAGDATVPLSEKIRGVVRKFATAGVTGKHLERRLGHRIDEMLPDEYADLVAAYNSIKDGMSQASDWFDTGKATTVSEAAEKIDSKLKPETEIKTETAAGVGVTEPPDINVCEYCGASVSDALRIASDNKFGRTLCREHQPADKEQP